MRYWNRIDWGDHLKRDLALGAIAGLIFSFACIGIFFWMLMSVFEEFETPNCVPANASEIARDNRFGFRIPLNATSICGSCTGLQSYACVARFEITSNDLTTFIATTHVEVHLSTALYPDTSSDDFLPSDLQSWQYGVYENGAFFQEVLIDTSDSNNFVVYMRTYGGN